MARHIECLWIYILFRTKHSGSYVVLGHIRPNGHKKHSAISERATRATQCDNVATGVACVLAATEKGQKVRERGGVGGEGSKRKTDMTFDTVTVYLAAG